MSSTTDAMTHTMEPEVATPLHRMPTRYHALAQDAHPLPSEDQITRVVFFIIMAVSVLFIGTSIFLSHM
jgi:hypothetical protein